MQWKLFLKQRKQEPSTWKTELWDRFSRHIFEISDATHPKAWEASQEVSSIHIDLRGRAFFSHPGFPSPPSTIMPVFWAKVTKWDDERWAKNQILYNHQASSSIIKHPAKYCQKFDFCFKIQTQIGVLSKCFVLKMEVKLEMCAKDPQPGHTWSFVGTWGAVGPEGNGDREKFADKRRPSRKIIWFRMIRNGFIFQWMKRKLICLQGLQDESEWSSNCVGITKMKGISHGRFWRKQFMLHKPWVIGFRSLAALPKTPPVLVVSQPIRRVLAKSLRLLRCHASGHSRCRTQQCRAPGAACQDITTNQGRTPWKFINKTPTAMKFNEWALRNV